MGEPIPLGRACGRCGEQVIVKVETDGGIYTDDLAALLEAGPTDTLVIEAHCNCPRPRTVALEGTQTPNTYRD